MAEIILGQKPLLKPFLARIYGVTYNEFVEWHAVEASAEWLDGQVVLESLWDESAICLVNWLYDLIRGVCQSAGRNQVLSPHSLQSLRSGRQFSPAISVRRISPQSNETTGQRADWIVELVTQANRPYCLGEKRDYYRAEKIPEIWYVDPDRRMVIVDHLQGGEHQRATINTGMLNSTAVPEFWLDVDWLWQSPLPPVDKCKSAIL